MTHADEARVASGRFRGLMSALTQLELVGGRLRDRAAVHGAINDPSGYHREAQRVLEDVSGRVEKMIVELTTEFSPDDEAVS